MPRLEIPPSPLRNMKRLLFLFLFLPFVGLAQIVLPGAPVILSGSSSGTGGSGTVNAGTIGQTAYYAANGTAVSGTSTFVLNAATNPVLDLGFAAGALPAAISANNVLQLGNADGVGTYIESDTFSNTGASGFWLQGRYAGGTRAVPAATPSGARFLEFQAFGFGTSYSTVAGAYRISAPSLWSASNWETQHIWLGTPNSSVTIAQWMALSGSAGLTVNPALRTSGVLPYFQISLPADTGITAATEGPGFRTVTATRTWATTGTVALQRENYFAAPTYASAGASQTFTDVFNLYVDKPIVGTNAIFTRPHTLGVVDATSAASSITGGFIVATTLGTAATSVGIGGGNVNAGGLITGGTVTSTGALTAGATSITGATGTTALTITNTARTSGILPYIKYTIPTDTAQTAATESPGILGVTGTRTWATTGTVALQREIFFPGPTYASASASQTFTDAFNMYLTPPVAGSNAIFTRGHTLGIVDATSAASSITGGLIVSAAVGTAATSTGIGNGNINTGGTLVVGGKTTSYNGVATAGWGTPAIQGAGRVTAQAAANATISTYTVGAADGSFQVSANMNVTVSTALTTTMTCTYTDESNTSRVMVMPVQQLTGSFIAAGAITGLGAWESPVMHIRCKAATTITIGTTAGTFTGVTYTAEGIIIQVN